MLIAYTVAIIGLVTIAYGAFSIKKPFILALIAYLSLLISGVIWIIATAGMEV